MPTFRVTTATTVYETYEVEAANLESARTVVKVPEMRRDLLSWSAGDGDDMEIIDVRRVTK